MRLSERGLDMLRILQRPYTIEGVERPNGGPKQHEHETDGIWSDRSLKQPMGRRMRRHQRSRTTGGAEC